MRVPASFLPCVLFLGIGVPSPDADSTVLAAIPLRGTAFFVHIPSLIHAQRVYTYLVTAQHVALRLAGHEFYTRINTHDDDAVFLSVPADQRWWIHPTDARVDVAVFPGFLPHETYVYSSIPTTMFVDDTPAAYPGIGAGSEVAVIGLFTRMSGEKRNQPLVRIGAVAMMPNEPIMINGLPMDAYLIEVRSFGGLSGSPVFVHDDAPGAKKWRLLGLVHGHWDMTPEEAHANLDMGDQETTDHINTGIAVVVPAAKILEVLNQPELQAMRDEEDARYTEELSSQGKDGTKE